MESLIDNLSKKTYNRFFYHYSKQSNNQSMIIQSFHEENSNALLKIAADTAFFGNPVEAFLEDRRLFCDFFYRYYITYQPQNCWVAMDHQTVIGFLVGCLDSRIQSHQWRNLILPQILKNAVLRKYRIGSLTWDFLLQSLQSRLTEKKNRIDLSLYPAHLHINVDANWRGKGVGQELLKKYIEYLSQNHIPGVHLNTTDQNISACKLYERMGFQLLSSHSTKLWSHLISNSVELRLYGLRLTDSINIDHTK